MAILPAVERGLTGACAKSFTGHFSTSGRISLAVRARWSGVTETRLSRSTALQSLPGMSSCWYPLPPIQ